MLQELHLIIPGADHSILNELCDGFMHALDDAEYPSRNMQIFVDLPDGLRHTYGPRFHKLSIDASNIMVALHNSLAESGFDWCVKYDGIVFDRMAIAAHLEVL